ncbi:hypothetical protein Trydic_g4298 [Trypoxylus dichotomus]
MGENINTCGSSKQDRRNLIPEEKTMIRDVFEGLCARGKICEVIRLCALLTRKLNSKLEENCCSSEADNSLPKISKHFLDEAYFHLNSHENRQNRHFWSSTTQNRTMRGVFTRQKLPFAQERRGKELSARALFKMTEVLQ